jgi:hypothetical protein
MTYGTYYDYFTDWSLCDLGQGPHTIKTQVNLEGILQFMCRVLFNLYMVGTQNDHHHDNQEGEKHQHPPHLFFTFKHHFNPCESNIDNQSS